MRVAQRDCQRVGGIFGLRIFAQAQRRSHHLLHLLFRRCAITRDAGLHLARRITVRRNRSLRRRQQHHAAHFSQPQSRSHIQRRKNRFHRHRIRRKFRHQRGDQFMDFAQPRPKFRARPHLQSAVAQHPRRRADEFDHAITRRPRRRRINAQHAESNRVRLRTRFYGQMRSHVMATSVVRGGGAV